MAQANVKAFFDEATFTVSYVVSDPTSNCAAIIDPVLDYDPNSGRTTTSSADQLIAYVTGANLSVAWILETHVHADHLSAAPTVKERVGGQTAIGAHVASVQSAFKSIFNISDLAVDG
ncbi:MAG: MBL fold metallo-hydrolase, partial [Woeseiaceae bacterium]|nr:MBL fold metallo-hydrolase [Woeseiaceae bacterium]